MWILISIFFSFFASGSVSVLTELGCLPATAKGLLSPSGQASLSGVGSNRPKQESRGNKRLLYLLIEFEWLFGLYMGYEICELEVKYELVNVTQMVEKSQGKLDNLCTGAEQGKDIFSAFTLYSDFLFGIVLFFSVYKVYRD